MNATPDEMFIRHVHCCIRDAMLQARLGRTALARRLGVTPSAVTQMLAPGRNLSLRRVALVLAACGKTATLSLHVRRS